MFQVVGTSLNQFERAMFVLGKNRIVEQRVPTLLNFLQRETAGKLAAEIHGSEIACLKEERIVSISV